MRGTRKRAISGSEIRSLIKIVRAARKQKRPENRCRPDSNRKTSSASLGASPSHYKPTDGISALTSSGISQTRDRKSTRLNSSHVKISYAVFCLKKKKKPK